MHTLKVTHCLCYQSDQEHHFRKTYSCAITRKQDKTILPPSTVALDKSLKMLKCSVIQLCVDTFFC